MKRCSLRPSYHNEKATGSTKSVQATNPKQPLDVPHVPLPRWNAPSIPHVLHLLAGQNIQKSLESLGSLGLEQVKGPVLGPLSRTATVDTTVVTPLVTYRNCNETQK